MSCRVFITLFSISFSVQFYLILYFIFALLYSVLLCPVVLKIQSRLDFYLHFISSSDHFPPSALRTGASAPNGEKITVGCLAKVEMNVQANAMRVTFRTLHPAASVSLMATAKIAFL